MSIYIGYTTQRRTTYNYYYNERVKTKEGALCDIICWSTNSSQLDVKKRNLNIGVCLPAKNISNPTIFDYVKKFSGNILENNTTMYSVHTLTDGNFTYSSDRKYVLIQFSLPTTSGSGSFNLGLLPAYEGMDFYIPFIGDTTNNNFWDKAINHSSVIYPWQEDPSKPGGGEGKWDDDTSDDIDLPNIDDLNENAINATEFMTLYQLSQDQLKNLGKALWSGNFLQALSNSALKPMDYILSFCMLPVYAGGTVKTIKAGGFVLSDMTEGVTVNGTVTTNQYVRVDCGELEINEKWGGAIDYQTDLTLYLPFIGMAKLSPQDVMNGKIKVIYTVDLLTGNCIATVKVTKGVLNSVLYNFTGNCSSSYPLSSRDFSTVFGSLITASSSIMGAATATKNASSLPDKTKREKYLKAKATESATSSWEGTGMQATNNLISGNFSPDVVRCGTMSANVGFMGIKKPFLIISRLKQSLPYNFGKQAGYMCNITKKLADCKGFTQVRFIHLDGVIATNTEKNELDSLLKEGVIIE